MHILAMLGGVGLHIFGDIALFIVGIVTMSGPVGYVYNQRYAFSSRGAAAFELLPMPIGLSLAGLILARWGIAGL